jgi:hypothetical protein
MLNDPCHKFRDRSVAVCAALAGTSVLALAGTFVAPTAADAATSCSLSQMSTSSEPACWHPFNGGPFNTQLSATPALASNSAAVVSHMAAYKWSVGNPGGGFQLGAGSRPVFFATTADPTMKIVCTNAFGSGSCTGANGVAIGGQTINVPAGLQPENGTDAHLTVIESGTGQEYDFWDASISGSTISAGSGSVVNTNTGNGLGAQGDAANFALSSGLLRPSELASGQINHALIVTVPCTNANGANVGYSYPATGGWGEACGDYWNETGNGAPMLGQLFRLNLTDAQIAASPAPAWQKTIMTALSHYGAYIEDTDGTYNSGIDVITQDSESWTDLGQTDQWSTLAKQDGNANGQLSSNVPIQASQLQVVSACVAQGTCPGSVMAPGTSTAPVTQPPAPTAPAAPVTKPTKPTAPAAPVTKPTKPTTPAAPVTKPQPTSGGSATGSTGAHGTVHHKHHKQGKAKDQGKHGAKHQNKKHGAKDQGKHGAKHHKHHNHHTS